MIRGISKAYEMKIATQRGGTPVPAVQHYLAENASDPTNKAAAFSDQLAAATQSATDQPHDHDVMRRDEFSDLVDTPALARVPQCFEPPIVRRGIDLAPSGLHAVRPATIEEIAAIPDLHERAVALLANDVKANTPEAKLLLESVRDEGPFGLFAYHGGMAPPPLPPRPKLKKWPVPKFPKYQLNNLFAPDAGQAAPMELVVMSSSDRRGDGREDREEQRSRDGAAGEIQKLVWGRNEEEYDKILEYEERLKSTAPRSHVLSRKYGSKKANARKKQ